MWALLCAYVCVGVRGRSCVLPFVSINRCAPFTPTAFSRSGVSCVPHRSCSQIFHFHVSPPLNRCDVNRQNCYRLYFTHTVMGRLLVESYRFETKIGETALSSTLRTLVQFGVRNDFISIPWYPSGFCRGCWWLLFPFCLEQPCFVGLLKVCYRFWQVVQCSKMSHIVFIFRTWTLRLRFATVFLRMDRSGEIGLMGHSKIHVLPICLFFQKMLYFLLPCFHPYAVAFLGHAKG